MCRSRKGTVVVCAEAKLRGMSFDDRVLEIAKSIVTPAYIDSARDALRSDQKIVRSIVAQRRAPENGVPEVLIEQILSTLSLMDSNNFSGHVGAGEREGRVFSSIVARRHWYMTHGIGRSGDLSADQPKAAGSSLLAQLTNLMVCDFLRLAGAEKIESAIAVPMATGMSLSLVLGSIRASRPRAKFVIWPRIDQRTCFKCIFCAGYEPVVVPLQPAEPPRRRRGKASQDKVETTETASASSPFVQVSLDAIHDAIIQVGPENVLAVLSTTSCFAPRLPDDVLGISRICAALEVPYVINNAYGVQSAGIMKALNSAIVHGRVDAVVQSGDKNFLVPVGGSIVAGSAPVIRAVSELYAGRASSAPILDLFVTLLSMGRIGFRRILASRQALLPAFHSAVIQVASEFGERVVVDPRNDISFAMTLTHIRNPLEIGAVLFRHCVTGPRVVVPSAEQKRVCGVPFLSYGMHFDSPSAPMLVMACGIGMTEEEVKGFIERLHRTMKAHSSYIADLVTMTSK